MDGSGHGLKDPERVGANQERAFYRSAECHLLLRGCTWLYEDKEARCFPPEPESRGQTLQELPS